MHLDDALAEWESWVSAAPDPAPLTNTRPELLSVFTAGLNHATAKLDLGYTLAALKVFNGDAEREIQSHRWASELGVAPSLLYVDPQSRYIVMAYAAGQALTAGAISNDAASLLGKALRKVHDAVDGPASHQAFDIQRFCENYLKDAGANAAQLHGQVAPYLAEFQRDSTPRCFCHNDLVAANVIFDGGDVCLLDWEFADYHNPWFDLAALIYYLKLSDEQTRVLLKAYARLPAAKLGERILTVSQIALLWGDILWHLAKFGEDYWPELTNKEQDLKGLMTKLNSSGA